MSLLGKDMQRFQMWVRKFCHDHPDGAIMFCSLSCGSHEVDWNGVHGGLFVCIEYELVLFPVFD